MKKINSTLKVPEAIDPKVFEDTCLCGTDTKTLLINGYLATIGSEAQKGWVIQTDSWLESSHKQVRLNTSFFGKSQERETSYLTLQIANYKPLTINTQNFSEIDKMEALKSGVSEIKITSGKLQIVVEGKEVFLPLKMRKVN